MSESYRQPAAATFDEAHKTKVEQLAKEFRNADIELIKQELRLHEPLYKKRAEVVADIDDFWFQALINCESTNVYIDDIDHEALSYLSNIEIDRDINDPRAAAVIFSFRENPFFSDKQLVKKFSLAEGANSLEDEFNFAEETTPEKTEINWKSEDKDLCKQRPTIGGRDEDDFEPGSFFSTFFENTDPQVSGGIGHTLIMEFFPNAIEFYTGSHEDLLDLMDDFDEDDEDDEEDDDDEEEIDLEEEEKRPKKRTKNE